VEEHRILFTLPKNLQAGVQQIQVVHQPLYKLQNSQELESNERTFVLHPIIATSCEGQDGMPQSQNDRAESEGITLTVEFKPNVGPQQQVIFKLTSANEKGGEDYRFEAPSRDSDTSVIRLPIDAAVTEGKYCVQVEVDGAENLTGMNQTGNVIHVIERSEPCDNPLQTEPCDNLLQTE
jgi:hypothetical protein